MPCIKALVLSSLQFISTLLPSIPTPSNTRYHHTDITISGDFHDTLSTLPESSIQAALSETLPNLYKEGMFEHDSSAIEAVHRTNAPLATKLLAAARYDLLRRQNGNLTTTNQAPPPVVVPITITSTNPSGSTVTSVATALSVATNSLTTTLTTTNSKGSTTLLTAIVPAAVITNANGQVTTSAAPTVNSKGLIEMTTTNAAGAIFVTTVTPSAGLVSSFVLQTTTLPDGSRSTFTSFAMVPASSATAAPKLQGDAPDLRPVTLSGLFVVLVAFGALLL